MLCYDLLKFFHIGLLLGRLHNKYLIFLSLPVELNHFFSELYPPLHTLTDKFFLSLKLPPCHRTVTSLYGKQKVLQSKYLRSKLGPYSLVNLLYYTVRTQLYRMSPLGLPPTHGLTLFYVFLLYICY